MKKTILLFYSFILFLFFVIPEVGFAQESSEIITRDLWGADEIIQGSEELYALPEKVLVISIPKSTYAFDEKSDIKELYYFFASRSSYKDIPFHYIIGQEGTIFQGYKHGAEATINIAGVSNAVIVGYLQTDNASFPVNSIPGLKKIITKIINTYAIPPEKVSLYQSEYKIKDGRLGSITLKNPQEESQEEFSVLQTAIKDSYDPPEKTFSVEVKDIIIPDEKLEPQTSTKVGLKIKNTGNINIYGSSFNTIFVAKKGDQDERSLLYDASSWDSFSRVKLLKDDEKLVTGKTETFYFTVGVGLYPPNISEEFVLVDFNGNIIEGTDFAVTLNIKKPKGKIIEILDTPIGVLNVRSKPGIGEVIAQAPSGSRYLVLDEIPGYAKIKIDDKEGWVYTLYVDFIKL